MLANLKEIYSSSLSNFTLSVKPSSFFFKFHVLNECRIRSKLMKWDGIKLSCVYASPLVHDVVRCFVSYFNFDYQVWHFQTQSNLQVHGMGEKMECKQCAR